MTPRQRRRGGTPRVWLALLLRSWRLDRWTTAGVLLLMVADAAALTVSGLSLRELVDRALGDAEQNVTPPAVAAGVSFAAILVISRVQQELRLDLADRVGMLEVDSEVQRFVSGLETIEHLERPAYLDRINRLRGRGQLMAESSWGVLDALSSTARVLVTLGLLATVQPALLLLVLLAVPALLLNRAGQRTVRQAAGTASGDDRVERELFDLTVGSGPGKELRVFGSGDWIAGLADRAWQRSSRIGAGARWKAALLGGIGWTVFTLGFAGALGVVTWQVSRGRGSVGDVVLLVTLAGTLRVQFERLAYSMSRIMAGLVAVEAYLWLRDYARTRGRGPADPVPVPPRLDRGLRLDRVGFAYPGTTRDVLRDITVDLPAGAMVALVGEHGSGKTTLVKLLCGLYPPDSGEITVDGVPMSAMSATEWRAACSGAFQDFGRYELTLGEAVGIGDPDRMGDRDLITASLDEAEGGSLVRTLPLGLDSPLGPGATELSEGQWQRVALARAAMRHHPLLLLLDEPTASLDPPTEHAVFTRHARIARDLGAATGAVTLVVTHRFTTVRMADLILVLRDGEIVESGDHTSLVGADGLYAELYRLQESAYATEGPS
ncbi:ABC transporter ATP-binding protein [Streptomyces sp. NBRC 109706]|uniref:ABC transporter ATP-binding protein n=1 Tax=Streptomyces sp. NBRC 109706 TaxID=1550035 RepID=UPI000836BE44|nr:ABC transporter ATP-binding protein [Streptomyces sp. NBRC 109706]